jgi:hypothetical protein
MGVGEVAIRKELDVREYIPPPRVPSFREFAGSPLPEQLMIGGLVVGGIALALFIVISTARQS